MKTRGLIAGAFALALGLSVSAADWFDAKIDTYTEWPIGDEVAEGGTWSNTDGATLDTTAAVKLVVDAEDDAALTFAATESKPIGDGLTINSTVTFNAFDALPAVPEGAKAALIAVKDGEDNYDIYGLTYSGSGTDNAWTKVLDNQPSIENVSVSIVLTDDTTNGKRVTYTVSGTTFGPTAVYSDGNVTGAAFSGCGEVTALAAEYVLPMGTLSVDASETLEVVSVVDTTDPEKTYTLDEGGNASIPVGATVRVTFAVKAGVKKIITGNSYVDVTFDDKTTKTVATDEVIETADAKAAIGTTYYLTFDAANENATADDTITLLADYEIGAETVTVKAGTVAIESEGTWKVILANAEAAFIYNDDGDMKDNNQIVLSEDLVTAGKILKFQDGTYKVADPGTVFTIVKGDGVESISVQDSNEQVIEIIGEKITVDPEDFTTFTITPVSTIEQPIYSGTGVTWGAVSGNVFVMANGDEGGTITFTVTEGKPAGVIFTLTATGIDGDPTYTLSGEAEARAFTAGGAGVWTATVAPNAVFTVNYTKASSIIIPMVAWTTDLTRDGNVITMGEAAGAATLAVTDAKDAPDDPTAQAAAKAAIADSVTEAAAGKTLEETKTMVAGQVDLLVENCGAKASEIAGWIETKGFTGAQVATAKAIDVSYDFGTDLFQTEAKAEVTAFAADDEVANTYAFEVQLKDGATPVAAKQAAQAAVEKIVQASSDVADFTTEAKKLTPTISNVAVSEGKLTFKVGLPTGAEKAFMRIAK